MAITCPVYNLPNAYLLPWPFDKKMAEDQHLTHLKLESSLFSPGQWMSFAGGPCLLIGHIFPKPSTPAGRRSLGTRQTLGDQPNRAVPPPPQCWRGRQTTIQAPTGSWEGTEDLHPAETCQDPVACELVEPRWDLRPPVSYQGSPLHPMQYLS